MEGGVDALPFPDGALTCAASTNALSFFPPVASRYPTPEARADGMSRHWQSE